jgi:rhodanese-related sulfurtransferase
MPKYFCFFFAFISFASCGQNNVPSLSPEAFSSEMINNPGTLIDVRTIEEFAEGHLPGAVNIDFYDDNFSDLIKKTASGKTVYLYCALGNRSAKAVKILEKKNIKSIHLKGGIEAWKNAGFETTQ